jgi:hypothetical protein
MDGIAKLKFKIIEVLTTLESNENFDQRAELIERLIKFRNLLNMLDNHIINNNMGMD